MQLRKSFRFEASHVLPKHLGKCSRLHGHSWVLHVYVEGPIDTETGFVMDYAEISSVMQPIIDALDHRHLGTWQRVDCMKNWSVPDLSLSFYPTSENLLWWIANQITAKLPKWSSLAIEETCTSAAVLLREEWNAAQGGKKTYGTARKRNV